MYDWLLFTSANAVERFWEVLRRHGLDARAVSRARLAAIGPATADALARCGLFPDVVPERFVAEGLLESLRSRTDVAGARFLYVTAVDARDVLPRGLEGLGAEVERVHAYRAVPSAGEAGVLRERIGRGEVNLATFASASTVRAFVDAVGADIARTVPAVTIGPITTDAAVAAGLTVMAEAGHSTLDGLVAAVLEAAKALAETGQAAAR
jgi:uroporphyrinogen-III synthase